MAHTIIHTIIVRPYVVIFLMTFLYISIRKQGILRTFLFLFSGYLIAWLSEACSIRTGFPYGWYFYIYENLQGEWLNWGVPVWDSASYVFLCFAGLCVAEKIGPQRGTIHRAFLAACFVTILDLIIDPIAHLGDQWFLGKIYYYPKPGFYFDVPLSNFAGWFLVSFLIVWVHLRMLRPTTYDLRPTSLGILFYFSIFLFNWLITLWLHQWFLAIIDLFWISIPFFLLTRTRYKTTTP